MIIVMNETDAEMENALKQAKAKKEKEEKKSRIFPQNITLGDMKGCCSEKKRKIAKPKCTNKININAPLPDGFSRGKRRARYPFFFVPLCYPPRIQHRTGEHPNECFLLLSIFFFFLFLWFFQEVCKDS